MALSKQAHRHRSPSDPFSDPPALSYSSYGVPTLSSYAPQQQYRRAPPVPPKVPAKPKQSSNSRSNARAPMSTEIVTTARQTDQSPRTRVGRSQTQLPPASSSRPAPAPPRRSLSQDSVVRAAGSAEKGKATARRSPAAKKGSSHADVIDRLDFSGVGPMFHHDGPFDACAPSRNRHRTKAPMFAWAGPAEEDKEALANAREIPSAQSPYPSPGVYTPYEAPKKKHDAIAEAWGIHEPEPFEDFSAGGGYSGGGTSEFAVPTLRNGATQSRRGKDSRDAREKYRDYLEEPQPTQPRRQQTKRSPIPPPQPIFVPESDADTNSNAFPPSPTVASPGAPKRTKSLMHRIRKMRDNPMVPPLSDEPLPSIDNEPSPPPSAENFSYQQGQRPSHRSQNSFLGGIFGAPRGRDLPSPSEEPYVYVSDSAPARREKSLPRPPTSPRDGPDGYFDPNSGYGGGGGLGRKTSLLRKVKTAVKGTGPANK